MDKKKLNTVEEEEKKKKKKRLFIILGCILGAGAVAGASVGIYYALQPKGTEYKVSCETNGITFSNSKVTIGQDFSAEIGINEVMVGEGYTLPETLTKVTSGNLVLTTENYTYELKEENKKADFKIPGEFVKGDISIDLELIVPETPYETFREAVVRLYNEESIRTKYVTHEQHINGEEEGEEFEEKVFNINEINISEGIATFSYEEGEAEHCDYILNPELVDAMEGSKGVFYDDVKYLIENDEYSITLYETKGQDVNTLKYTFNEDMVTIRFEAAKNQEVSVQYTITYE